MKKNVFSSWYDPNSPEVATGKFHNWEYQENSDYYGSAYKCLDCGKKNIGWNLWKEDLLPTCRITTLAPDANSISFDVEGKSGPAPSTNLHIKDPRR